MRLCISSIQNQTYKNYEVWIIDNMSTDGTQEFLKLLEAPFFYISEKDSGIYDAMNKGIEKSVGNWLYFIGTDDVLFNTDVLKTVYRHLGNSYLIYGDVLYDSKKFVSKWSRRLWFKNTLHHQSIIYNHAIFKDKLYNANLKILADYHLNLILFKEKVRVKKLLMVIAKCGSKGASKQYSWSQYKEEISLKVTISNKLLLPFFYCMAFSKYSLRKLIGFFRH